MKKLIELDAALEGLENLNAVSFYEENEHSKEAYMETKDMLKDLPTVDAAPVVHGRWIIKDNPGIGWYRVTCSECGEDVTSTIPMIGFFPNCKAIWDYCPYCGAKMDEKDGGNYEKVG